MLVSILRGFIFCKQNVLATHWPAANRRGTFYYVKCKALVAKPQFMPKAPLAVDIRGSYLLRTICSAKRLFSISDQIFLVIKPK